MSQSNRQSLLQHLKILSTSRLFDVCGLQPAEAERMLSRIQEGSTADCWEWNRSCCNPHHLYEGTKADNSRDVVNRNRHGGGGGGPAKLTQTIADQIRRELVGGGLSQAAIARKYDISPEIVVGIKKGRIWTGEDRRFSTQGARNVTDQDVRRVFDEVKDLGIASGRLGLSKTTIWRRLQKTGGMQPSKSVLAPRKSFV